MGATINKVGCFAGQVEKSGKAWISERRWERENTIPYIPSYLAPLMVQKIGKMTIWCLGL
jgi:hypothetical protein